MKPTRFVLSAALAFFAFAVATDADAARRWFVDASGVIVAVSDNDGGHTPAGTTAVLDETIRMADPPGATGDILSQGTWIAGVYAPPTGVVIAIDPTTPVGAVQTSCRAMLRTFARALDYIYENRFAWQGATIKKGPSTASIGRASTPPGWRSTPRGRTRGVRSFARSRRAGRWA